MPDEVIDAVKDEFRKHRKCLGQVTPARVREYLRKLDKTNQNLPNAIKYSAYYEHIPLIVERITGNAPPWLNAEQESKIIWIFYMLEPAYDAVPRAIRGSRTNFLHYPYIIYKLCELLGYTHILPQLTLLKSRVRLRQHDRIWLEMLRWLRLDQFYIPTV